MPLMYCYTDVIVFPPPPDDNIHHVSRLTRITLHAPPARAASVRLNRSANHGAPRTPSRSASPPASLSDSLAEFLFPEEAPPPSTVTEAASRRQNSLRAWKQELASPARAKAQAALYAESVSEVSIEHARESRVPAS